MKLNLNSHFYLKVLEMDPANGYAKVHLGFIFKVIDNNPEKSIPLLTEGIASEDEGTKDGRFYFHLGDALQRLNQTENVSKKCGFIYFSHSH